MRFSKRLTGLLLGICAATAGMGQTQLYSSDITAASVKLNWSYDLTPQQGVYYGAYAPDMTGFITDAGKPVSVWHKYVAWGSSWNAFPTSTITSIRSSGAVPLITWEPWAYNITDANYQLADIINGNYDSYITTWATAAKNWGHPFFLRFAHEMNGKTWYPWQEGLNGNTAGEYVQAWKHVVDIFRAVGANNVNWVWCPNVKYTGSTSMTSQYPGDDYVDWLALDGYNRATSSSSWKTFATVYDASFNELAQISPNKNIMIAEIGCTENGGSKAGWITDAITSQLQQHPKVKALVWFNHTDVNDYSIESSTAATAAFSAAIAAPSFLTNVFNTLGALSFEVRYRPEGDVEWTSSLTNNYSLDITGLNPATQYEFQVRAMNATGYTPYSPSSYFTTDGVVTSVSDVTKDIRYDMYPNPFEGEFSIKVTSDERYALEVNVFDTKGSLVYSSNEHFSNERFTIGSELSNGLYFVHVKAPGQKTWVNKVVKTK